MATALSQETAKACGNLQFSNTLTNIHVRSPTVSVTRDLLLAPARSSFIVNNFTHLPKGAIFHYCSDNVPFECPLTHLLPLSPNTTRDIRFSLFAAMSDPSPDVVDFLEYVVSQSAYEAAVETVCEGSDGFSLIAEINAFFPPSGLDTIEEGTNEDVIDEEVIDDILIFNTNDDEGGGGESTVATGEVVSTLVRRINTLEFGKDCGSAEGDCCSICLVEFEVEIRLKKTVCSHLFHDNCLHSWLQRKASCPSCPMCWADIVAN